MPGSKPDSTEDRILRNCIPEPNSGCWLWLGWLNQHGYGRFKISNNGNVYQTMAHRASYEFYKELIPEGMELDHKCEVRCCVNPDHLELVTRTENIHRTVKRGRHRSHNTNKTHCNHGHEFTTDNTYISKEGWRCCKACRRERYHKNKNR